MPALAGGGAPLVIPSNKSACGSEERPGTIIV
jgi:hypothetical protein